jgi:hypothetical protein
MLRHNLSCGFVFSTTAYLLRNTPEFLAHLEKICDERANSCSATHTQSITSADFNPRHKSRRMRQEVLRRIQSPEQGPKNISAENDCRCDGLRHRSVRCHAQHLSPDPLQPVPHGPRKRRKGAQTNSAPSSKCISAKEFPPAPPGNGFVFSKDQVSAHAQRLMRQPPAFRHLDY